MFLQVSLLVSGLLALLLKDSTVHAIDANGANLNTNKAPLDNLGEEKLTELDMVSIRLESVKERCLVEELPENTVVLVKHSASSWSSISKQRSDIPFQLLVTVRDPSGYTTVRQQSKPKDRLFLTAATSGPHLICYQAMFMQYSPNSIVKVGLEVFIGEAGDPYITSPVEAHMSDLSFQIEKASEHGSDMQREQVLQRQREAFYQKKSSRLLSMVYYAAFFQALLIVGASLYQVHHLRKFFRAKKLV